MGQETSEARALSLGETGEGGGGGQELLLKAGITARLAMGEEEPSLSKDLWGMTNRRDPVEPRDYLSGIQGRNAIAKAVRRRLCGIN